MRFPGHRFFIGLLLILGFAGLDPVSMAAPGAQPPGNDKSAVITIDSYDVTQGSEAVGDTLDAAQPFSVRITFHFPIVDDAMIGTPPAGGITDVSQQINDGDIAYFDLGKNFEAVDAGGRQIPVYVNAPGGADHGKQIGTIHLLSGEGNTVRAKMEFHDPKGEFNYESDGRRDVSVVFTGEFKAVKNIQENPGSPDSVIAVFDKQLKPRVESEKITYEFTKTGKIADPVTREAIEWSLTVKKNSKSGSSLAGEVFTDNLSQVGELIDGSFKVNGEAVSGAYDSDTKVLSYTFPEDFAKPTATITFSTKVADPTVNSIKNTATLKVSNEETKKAEHTVPLYKRPGISKGFERVEFDQESQEKSLIWTVVAGTPHFNYGPAWVGDILHAQLDGQVPPKRQELVVERSMTGENGTWEKVSEFEVLDPDAAKNFPVFPQGADTSCPDVSAYDKEVYDLGIGWHPGTRPAADSSYYELQNHWAFIPELHGQYRFTVKLVYDEDTEVGQLKNDAEIHICGDTVYPASSPVYSGVGTISKRGLKSYNTDFLNQGIIPWSVTVDFTKVLPGDDRFVYEAFYYGSEEDFAKEEGIHADGDFPVGTVEKLLEKDNGEYRVNFHQRFVPGSLELSEEAQLSDKTFALRNGAGEQIGELVQISGFNDAKSYTFKLQTRAQDLLDMIEASQVGKFSSRYKNTAVLAVGSGETLKLLPASDYYDIEGRLLDKYVLEYDTDLDSLTSVSKNGWSSSYRDYLTGIPQVDPGKTFNYKDRTAFFRIDVNPLGLKWAEYVKSLGLPSDFDMSSLTVSDVLPDGFSLEPIDAAGSDLFAIYEADPLSPAFIDYSITYPGSPQFNTYMPPGKATKRVSATEAGVSFDRDALTWNFQNYQGKPYFIVIKAKMSEDAFSDLVRNAAQAKSETYTNKVSLSANGRDLAKATADLELLPYLLIKDDPKVEDSTLNWTFTYKPFDQDFRDVVLKDILDPNIAISLDDQGEPVLSDFTITRSNELQENGEYANFSDVTPVHGKPQDGEVGLSYDSVNHAILFTLPDTPASTAPSAYRVEYPSYLRVINPDAESIINHVEASASNVAISASGEGKLQTQSYAAFARLSGTPYVALKKIDEGGQALADAVFSYVDASGETVNTVSNKDGMVYAVNLPENSVTITELTAPEGFTKLSTPIVISVAEKPYSVTSGLTDVKGKGTFNDPFLVVNEKAPEPTPDPTPEPTPDPTPEPKPDPTPEPGNEGTPPSAEEGKLPSTGAPATPWLVSIAILSLVTGAYLTTRRSLED